jgi:hypothetical protein
MPLDPIEPAVLIETAADRHYDCRWEPAIFASPCGMSQAFDQLDVGLNLRRLVAGPPAEHLGNVSNDGAAIVRSGRDRLLASRASVARDGAVEAAP